jgi:hypothetical protein
MIFFNGFRTLFNDKINNFFLTMRAAGSEAAPQKLKRDLHPSKKNSNLRLLTQRQIVNIDHLDRTGLE